MISERTEAAPGLQIQCRNCHRAYPEGGHPYRCSHCGGVFDFKQPLVYAPRRSPDHQTRPGLSRFSSTFPLPGDAPLVSLGEGDTPLLPVEVDRRRVYFKAEHLNPTGSFKDRGSLVLVSALSADGVELAIEDSSGNAGASFAAYAARAGMKARIFIPDYASGPKRSQIEAYGAEVVRVLGPRSAASEAVAREAEKGSVYASHAYLPHGLAGLATIAFEVYEQLGQTPGALVVPVGQGTLLLGAHRGFEALVRAGLASALPRLVAVQAQACAPIWAVSAGGGSGLMWAKEGNTLAEGIRILHPLRGDDVLRALEASGGLAVAVDEHDILLGQREIARLGFFVEPTSAVVWPALRQTMDRLPDPIVVVLTGSGLKSPYTATGGNL